MRVYKIVSFSVVIFLITVLFAGAVAVPVAAVPTDTMWLDSLLLTADTHDHHNWIVLYERNSSRPDLYPCPRNNGSADPSNNCPGQLIMGRISGAANKNKSSQSSMPPNPFFSRR